MLLKYGGLSLLRQPNYEGLLVSDQARSKYSHNPAILEQLGLSPAKADIELPPQSLQSFGAPGFGQTNAAPSAPHNPMLSQQQHQHQNFGHVQREGQAMNMSDTSSNQFGEQQDSAHPFARQSDHDTAHPFAQQDNDAHPFAQQGNNDAHHPFGQQNDEFGALDVVYAGSFNGRSSNGSVGSGSGSGIGSGSGSGSVGSMAQAHQQNDMFAVSSSETCATNPTGVASSCPQCWRRCRC